MAMQALQRKQNKIFKSACPYIQKNVLFRIKIPLNIDF